MTHIKLEHIDNLRRGKASGAKIGSRKTPHHLYQYETEKYTRALKNKYLEIEAQERINLKNIWSKVCIAKQWKEYILVKNTKTNIGEIFLGNTFLGSGNLKEMKQSIKNLVHNENT